MRLASRSTVFLTATCALLGLSCPQTVHPTHAPPIAVAPPRAIAIEPTMGVEPDSVDSVAALPALDVPPEPGLPEDVLVALESAVEEGAAIERAAETPVATPRKEQFHMVATADATWVFAKPNSKARKLGYLRAGAVVERRQKAAGYAGCKQGWYGIEPDGYVCAGSSASLQTHHPVVEAAARRADRSQGLPYLYGMSRFPPPPMYVRLPSEQDQARVEEDLTRHLRQKNDVEPFRPFVGPVPGSLLYERMMPSITGKPYGANLLEVGRPVARSGFGILETFEWTGRLFGVTTDLVVVPLDRVRFIETSSLRGLQFKEGEELPALFVRARHEKRYSIDQETKAITEAGLLGYRQGVALTGKRLRIRGQSYFEARDGTFIRDNKNVLLLPGMENVPGWAKGNRKWIDVSILRQTLVAYEGSRPVFATLVSTGADGLGDPEKTHSTVLGAFLIHTKHVTAKMSNDEEGDVYDLKDVPYVQYFKEGYAIHGAYWHDQFGTPRSHGCINVSPADAAWLFAWTDPQVPEDWHGRLELHKGTLVYTHP